MYCTAELNEIIKNLFHLPSSMKIMKVFTAGGAGSADKMSSKT